MSRIVIRCGNYFGQKYDGVMNSSNMILRYYNNKESYVGKDLYSTLWNLYYKHQNIESSQKRVTVGGDHSTSIASLAWTLNNYPDSKVIWIDAHADINTFESSKSKNYHGMPLSFLSGLDSNKNFDFIKNKLDLNNLLYVGLRDLDDFEKDIIDKKNIKCVDVNTFNSRNFNDINNFIENSNYHLSFDVDAIDPKDMPCTGTPVENGIKLDSFLYFLESLDMENMINMDIVELNLEMGKPNDFEISLKNIRKIEETLSNRFES